MSDLISRQDAILWIKNIINDIGSPRHSDLWGYEEALYEIQKLLKEDSAQKWIPCSEMSDLISRQDAIDAMATWDWQEMYLPIHFKQLLESLPSAEHKKLSNREWVDFLEEQFDISRTSAKEMLHAMMSVKREDNFKKQFSGGKENR